jgi:CRISPR-associated endonuclease/helicase Cas3
MNTHLAFWAKLGDATWPERYHPVLCHLIDVAAVASALWDKVFRPRFRAWFSGRLGLDEAACGQWLPFWSGAHDIGKVAPCFQFRNNAQTRGLKALEKDGFQFLGSEWPHGTISAAVLADLLAHPLGWPPVSEPFAARLAVAVGGHHGLFPPDWNEVGAVLKAAKWDHTWHAARGELLRALAGLLGVKGERPQQSNPADQSVLMILAGLTSVADWIGSNQTFFAPCGNRDVAARGLDLDAYFHHATDQARLALKELGWLDHEPSAGPRAFVDLFAGILAGKPRPLQEVVEALARNLAEPALLLIESPMGEGKTEAAWYVADTWDRRGGQGTYVALPTMATSNQMFERVGRFLERNPAKKNVLLVHGKAQLNELFTDRLRLGEIYDHEARPSAVVAEGWFAANKKHGLLAPFGVGTIDQALLAVLQTRHVFVRLFGLAGKCVILDEVHAYDAYMSTLLERLLTWLAALGCPVVLLSATLPRERRQKLLQAYAFGGPGLTYADEPYPRVTLMQPGNPSRIRVEHAEAARARVVRLTSLQSENLAGKLSDALAGGGCAVVLRNTVGLAQQTYLQLRDALKDTGITIDLFHARFPFGRRMEIETEVLKRFGKDSQPAERDRCILVATQVVEQSLDLDFDLMVSDVAPVDLLLQRVGRLWRHERSWRGDISGPTMYVLRPDLGLDSVPAFGASERIYARYVLLRSVLALRNVDQVRLPQDVEDLIEHVYGPELPSAPSPAWEKALNASCAQLAEVRKKQRLCARSLAIRLPDDQSVLEQQNLQLEEDNPEAHERIRAATRDTEPTVQLIVVYCGPKGHTLDSSATVPIRLERAPTRPEVKAILCNEVSISHRGCVAFYARKEPPKAWRENGLLRYHRVVLFGPDGCSSEGEFPLQVDKDLGIVFGRPEDQKD